MANFDRDGNNIHGQTITATAGRELVVGVDGPMDTLVSPPVELTVEPDPPGSAICIPGALKNNIRSWTITPTVAAQALLAKTRGQTWSTIYLNVTPVPLGPLNPTAGTAIEHQAVYGVAPGAKVDMHHYLLPAVCPAARALAASSIAGMFVLL